MNPIIVYKFNKLPENFESQYIKNSKTTLLVFCI